MTEINSQIAPTTKSVSELTRQFQQGILVVDETFQRKLVWGDKQKVRLVETILIGYPIPEIYLHQLPSDPDTGEQKYSIVDGQQRLSCLTQFVSNEWTLNEKYLDDKNKKQMYSNKLWNGHLHQAYDLSRARLVSV